MELTFVVVLQGITWCNFVCVYRELPFAVWVRRVIIAASNKVITKQLTMRDSALEDGDRVGDENGCVSTAVTERHLKSLKHRAVGSRVLFDLLLAGSLYRTP